MELKKESQKIALENTIDLLKEIALTDESITEEVIQKFSQAFELIVSTGHTELLMAFALLCIESVDLDVFRAFQNAYAKRSSMVYWHNSAIYTALNAIGAEESKKPSHEN